ncbi:substrate-binding domain-containing protein [Actinocorallia sp. API 0066]|uniref:sugar ABC transporter substrate-binding protein n=1 Tax=Actinocorallia sp. API 0066 TaxID=2896846 RepID=UPI001E531934|nr:substrate-binding domain-containing protein [Actinocorallia sp. API 0066]MCD0449160.1 substrate-binding domain-containing protein [Actinocorallia sp. API 0066]
MKITWTRQLTASAAAAALALGVAACGGSSGGGGGEGTAADTAGLKQAKALADTYSTPPTSIGITVPVGKPVPSGKTIIAIGAGPGGQGTILTYKAVTEAARLFGWTVKVIQPQSPTPQLFQQALTQAIQLKPDAVLISATEVAAIQDQLKELKSKNIPVISSTGPDPTGDLLTLQIMGTDGLSGLATAVADKTLADLDGPGEIGMVGIQGYKIINDYSVAYRDEVKELCPSCTIKDTSIPVTALGTNDGTLIVNFLRANPNLKALFVGYDGMATNLIAAAKAAGVTLPKTYSVATAVSNIPHVASGALTASAPFDQPELGWRTVDALARIFTGQTDAALDLAVQYTRPLIWAKDFNNVPPAPEAQTFPKLVPDYEEQYKKLWGK